MPEDKPLDFKRDEDFTSLYSNNVQFESTLWDLKLLFGQVDLAKSVIEQHTAMAVPWPYAKIAAYYMMVNVILHQSNNGNIFIPPNVMPTRPNPDDPTIPDDNGRQVVAYLGWVHDQVFGTDPYIPPEVAKFAVKPDSTTK
ncbi:MAG TPA: hypothetical protein VK752_14725 [Bryobacteraceae bacterium]|jgi:hypothetical protein|nr:hypothetical protein [Bryobacteraceae bacterium]